jgi:hypothetical protein
MGQFIAIAQGVRLRALRLPTHHFTAFHHENHSDLHIYTVCYTVYTTYYVPHSKMV